MAIEKIISFDNGSKVSLIGQGTYLMGQNTDKANQEISALRYGIDLGLNMIDTAEMYGNEEFVSKAIEGLRSKVFLVSKVWPTHADYQGTINACEHSLKRLKTDVIDLYLLHWRSSFPIEKTIEAMTHLQQSGKIRLWGVSNLPLEDMQKISTLPGGAACATDQVLYNLGERGVEYDLLPWLREHHKPMISYKPLGRGELLAAPALQAVAAKHGVSTACVAIAWAIRSGDVVAIPKASTIEHVKENYKALEIRLDADDLKIIDLAFPAPIAPVPMNVTPPENKSV